MLIVTILAIFAKPRLSQVNVRPNLSTTGRDRQLLANFALYSMI